MNIRTPVLILLAMLTLSACATVSGELGDPRTAEDYYNKAMNFFNHGNYVDAVPAFEKVREKFPVSNFAVLAELRLGESHFRQEQWPEAAHYFENFRRLHPSNVEVPFSIYMAGMCSFAQILSADRDQTYAREAAEQFQILVDLYPASPYAGKALCKISEARQRLAENQFFVARFYARKENYPAAVERYTRILSTYPHDIAKDKVLFYLAEALLLDGQPEKARRVLALLINRFPAGDYLPEAQALLAQHAPTDS